MRVDEGAIHRGAVTVTFVDVAGGIRGQQRRLATGGHRWAEPSGVRAGDTVGVV